ncbi:MAG: tripartite tricarboxylate transporter substrate-binding protein [Xanthobacteraceae bacterium]|jgi:tripartite-type tricarboxylate transporter receptor subunit TctC
MQRIMKMRTAAFLAAAFAATLGPIANATAQSYPSRPISIIVPFPPGGQVDTLARILLDRMRAALGQTIIIENVGGASGGIGVTRVVRSAPDGYTLSMGNWTSHVGGPAIYPVQFDILKDLEPIAMLPAAPTIIVARQNMPANNLRELVAWLKANPDKATAATVGAGSPGHVSGLHFQSETGTRMQFVPYRGGGPANQDLLAGQVDMRIGAEASQMLPHVRGGRVKAYAVMAKNRWAAAPDIPTIDEAGVPGVHISVWTGIWAPKGTPKDVLARLNAAMVEILADEVVRKRVAEIGSEIPPLGQQTPEALAAFHKAETDKWWPIIKAANIKAEQ